MGVTFHVPKPANIAAKSRLTGSGSTLARPTVSSQISQIPSMIEVREHKVDDESLQGEALAHSEGEVCLGLFSWPLEKVPNRLR